ncbi:hypothetical protein FRC08_000623 [Ceratobasidium sp. 394]|nr:hypothetical protein FRC08_000623 [Ceratobasidium sp. 394]
MGSLAMSADPAKNSVIDYLQMFMYQEHPVDQRLTRMGVGGFEQMTVWKCSVIHLGQLSLEQLAFQERASAIVPLLLSRKIQERVAVCLLALTGFHESYFPFLL